MCALGLPNDRGETWRAEQKHKHAINTVRLNADSIMALRNARKSGKVDSGAEERVKQKLKEKEEEAAKAEFLARNR